MKAEKIKTKACECDCDWCGQRLYVGDTCRVRLDLGTVYCSHACAALDTFDAGYGNGGTCATMRTE